MTLHCYWSAVIGRQSYRYVGSTKHVRSTAVVHRRSPCHFEVVFGNRSQALAGAVMNADTGCPAWARLHLTHSGVWTASEDLDVVQSLQGKIGQGLTQ